jgi:predicted enzyme related to lactoylglutathione lyase
LGERLAQTQFRGTQGWSTVEERYREVCGHSRRRVVVYGVGLFRFGPGGAVQHHGECVAKLDALFDERGLIRLLTLNNLLGLGNLELSDADGVEMLGGSSPIYLLVKAVGTTAAGTATLKRSYARHWTPVHFDFVVEDIECAVQQAVAAGAQLESAVTTAKWGRLALMADPFGHGFCFVQFLGRGYDELPS